LEFPANQKRSRASNHKIKFGNVVMRPAVQRCSSSRLRFIVQDVRAQVVAFGNINHARWMISVCFHQCLEIGMRNKSKSGLCSRALDLVLRLSRSQKAHRQGTYECESTQKQAFLHNLVPSSENSLKFVRLRNVNQLFSL